MTDHDDDKTQTHVVLTEGTNVSHYRILEKIGEGGMGEVYLAEDTKLNRSVALKFLPKSMSQDSDIRSRFIREAQAVARLDHQNIVTIYEVSEFNNRPFFAMQYIEGNTLQHYCKSETLPISQILELVSQVSSGLSNAHESGITHRDIKSANIVVDKELRPHILDFGLATLVGSEMITKAGSTLGTIAYMSPEQAKGLKVDPRSDIFSLAVVLYELIAGRTPLKRDNEAATINAILNESPEPLARYKSDVAPELQRIVDKALAKNPAERYQSAADFSADLTALRRSSESGEFRNTGKVAVVTPSIVVLPFVNLSSDSDNEYFSDGLTEEIISDLSKVKSLSVISRTSSMQLKNTQKDIRTIGRELSVSYVLEGSVRKAGANLRITAQLIDALTDAHLWSEKYSGTIDEVFEVQERVSREIVKALNLTLTHDESDQLAEHPIASVTAFQLYLQARMELGRYAPERASKFIEQAIEIEGETPPLRAVRAWAKISQVRAGRNRDLSQLDEAQAEANELLKIAPNAPYGHSLLGYIGYERGNLADAVKHCKAALKIEPNDADTLFYLGIAYMAASQPDLSTETAKRLVACDPLSPLSWLLLSVAPWFTGQFDDSLEATVRALEMDPQNVISHWTAGYFYASVGKLDEAAERAKWLEDNAPEMSYSKQLLSLVDALNGRKDQAIERLEVIDITPLDAHNTFHFAESYIVAGAVDRGLDLLESSVESGFFPVMFFKEHCPFLESVRGTSRFETIVAKAQSQKEKFEQAIGAQS